MERWVSWFQNSLRTRKQDCVWLHFPWGGTPIAPQFRPLLHLLTSLSQTWWNHISSSSSSAEAVASLSSDLMLKTARPWSCRILIYSRFYLKFSVIHMRYKKCQNDPVNNEHFYWNRGNTSMFWHHIWIERMIYKICLKTAQRKSIIHQHNLDHESHLITTN